MATSKAPEALPPEDCVRRIQSLVLADLRPVRPLPSEGWLLVAIGVVWVAVVCAGFWFYGGYGWSALSRQRQVAIFFPLAVAASLMALAAVRQMSPGSVLVILKSIFPVGSIVPSIWHPRRPSRLAT